MTTENKVTAKSGWSMLWLLLVAEFGALSTTIWLIAQAKAAHGGPIYVVGIIGAAMLGVLIFVLLTGLFTLQPNQAAVLTLFGDYKGTVREPGFHWANPFLIKQRVSLRSQNFNSEKLKVNDQRGNPIEIACVVVWRVEDSAKSRFDVESLDQYVHVQSESALRHLASRYPYDSHEGHEVSLRSGIDEVTHALQDELQGRLSKAGVIVEEARIAHLAYAQEIAGAMLRRQQAEAVVAARFRIVEGAVGMVEAALAHLEAKKTIVLDDERKAAMVSNLLVVLCGDHGAQPVVNAGTLYGG
jgi:regulator of protease activity HflC (stomatin/prohibitin superfamily)